MDEQQQQNMMVLAAIGDLEVARRQLLMQLQQRDERIAELEEQLGITSQQPPNGQVAVETVSA